MKNYNNHSHSGKKEGGYPRGGQRNSYGGGGGGGNDRRRDEGPRTMHSATCSDCGKNAQVPFKPTGDKPVFCSDCFGSKKDSNTSFERNNDRRGGGDRSFDRGNDRRGGSDRPSFKDNRGPKTSGGGDTQKLERQIDALHKKMDKVLASLGEDVPGLQSAEENFSLPKSAKKKIAKRVPPAEGELKAAIEKAKPKKKTAKKVTAKKDTKKKTAAKKVAKKAPAKKVVAKKALVKKAAAKKTVAKKAVAKKAAAKKTTKKK
jgi:CxxC-x17-CxxC domain-containing protein